VDDEVAVLETLSEQLGALFADQYDIASARSAEEALELLAELQDERIPLAMVIADQIMPGMAGDEFLIRVYQQYPESIKILLTGYAGLDSAVNAINNAGLHRYLTKPWEREDLQLTTTNLLEQYRLDQENRILLETLETRNRELERALEELKQAQAEREKSARLAAIGEMAGTIIHDFKNPMTTILGAVQMLCEKGLAPDRRQWYKELVQREIDRMRHLTQDLLDFGRGETHLTLEPCTVGDLLNDFRESVEQDFQQQGVALHLSLENPDRQLLVDRERINRCLGNLADNSREAMPQGGMFAVQTELQEGYLWFAVADNGPGIPEAIRDRLFEPFVSYGKRHGTGLGMAIVQSIIRAHGGDITFETETGRGTTFFIRLPLPTDSTPASQDPVFLAEAVERDARAEVAP
jgi:signal transduction histidine kinase